MKRLMKLIGEKRDQRGFTLIELMVVIAILGILAAIAIPKFTEATANANGARIQADLRTIDSAIILYQVQGNDMTKLSFATLKSAGCLTYEPQTPTGKFKIGHQNAAIISAVVYEIANERAVFQQMTVENLQSGKS